MKNSLYNFLTGVVILLFIITLVWSINIEWDYIFNDAAIKSSERTWNFVTGPLTTLVPALILQWILFYSKIK